MDDLKPCPFCGSANLELQNLVDEDDYFVACLDCEVQQIANNTEAQAVAKWNRRAGGVTNLLAVVDAWSHADPAQAAAIFAQAVPIHIGLHEPEEAFIRARLAAHFRAKARAQREEAANV